MLPCSRDNVSMVTDAVMESSLVTKFSFTGSTAVGKVLLQFQILLHSLLNNTCVFDEAFLRFVLMIVLHLFYRFFSFKVITKSMCKHGEESFNGTWRKRTFHCIQQRGP